MTESANNLPEKTTNESSSFLNAEVFWALHYKKVIIAFVALFAAIIAVSVYFGIQAMQRHKAQDAYDNASSMEDWQKVIQQYPHTIVAGNAYLRIAAEQAKESKWKDSNDTYQTFVKECPQHPLIMNGYMGLAQNAEKERNLDTAIQYYKDIVEKYDKSYIAPLALYNQARLTEEKGQLDAAYQLYTGFKSRFPQSNIGMETEQKARQLETLIALKKEEKNPSNTAEATKEIKETKAGGNPVATSESKAQQKKQ